MRKILLKLSEEDQKALGYENPDIEHDVNYLFGEDFDVFTTHRQKKRIIETVRTDLRIPKGYLKLSDYNVAEFKEDIHIYPKVRKST